MILSNVGISFKPSFQVIDTSYVQARTDDAIAIISYNINNWNLRISEMAIAYAQISQTRIQILTRLKKYIHEYTFEHENPYERD